ncbi:alpha-L-fucosidase [Pedobacter sp. GSP4]|uniref:alpha-L-fucosidase n=1 Tax=Pedobacter sp. GSP4 TaxID=3453716 RepID=UPI003EEAE8E0
MKIQFSNKLALSIIFILIATHSFSQWSVLSSDPRPAHDKGEQYLYQVFTAQQWNASNFAKPESIKWHNDARYGMFIHFGLNSYVNKDMSWPIVYNRKAPDQGHGAYPDSTWQKIWPSLFKLEKFNADEWVKIAKDAGMKYIVVIAKHHDGFHMWDTKYSDFKITNTPFKRDYLKEVINACHKAGMPVGLYYSQRDWYHPDYAPIDTNTIKRIPNPPYYEALPGKKVIPGATHHKYIDYQFNVVRELLTKYGKIDIFWFDAVWWGGMFNADMWEAEKLTRMIRQLQPGILINNRTSLPGDFDTPEQRIGMYQKRSWESAMTLNGSWGYDPSHPIRSAKSLIKEMLTAAAGNGNVLLSWGAHFDGEWDPAQKDTLLKVGSWLKKYGTAYYGTRGGPWMPTKDYGSVHKGNKVYLYVFNWQNQKLTLPSLKDNAIIKASFINLNEKVVWSKEGTNLQFNSPNLPDASVTILELTMQKPIKEILEKSTWSLFDDPAYGEKILTKQIKTTDWKQNSYTIDFGNVKNTTGIGCYNNDGNISISISTDGKKWEAGGNAKEKTEEISFSTFMTGVYVPGKTIRYIRLQGEKPSSLKIEVYAK